MWELIQIFMKKLFHPKSYRLLDVKISTGVIGFFGGNKEQIEGLEKAIEHIHQKELQTM